MGSNGGGPTHLPYVLLQPACLGTGVQGVDALPCPPSPPPGLSTPPAGGGSLLPLLGADNPGLEEKVGGCERSPDAVCDFEERGGALRRC